MNGKHASSESTYRFSHQSLLGIHSLSPLDITFLLDLADNYVKQNRRTNKKCNILQGRTQINLFFENSTRTQSSFELAGKRLGADVMNMNISTSSVKKGETLLDTAVTLNAMNPDLLIVRHNLSGAVNLLSQKVSCPVLNAGDGAHEHPTQALLDALTIRHYFGKIEGLRIAICGDIMHSRVARSNILLLTLMGAIIHLIAPRTMLPHSIERMGVLCFTRMKEGLKDCDVIMTLRIQQERMIGTFISSEREYYHLYGLDYEKLSWTNKTHTMIMHPGPMNRGVEIDSILADDSTRSLIAKQVEMGVAVRMAVLDALSRQLSKNGEH